MPGAPLTTIRGGLIASSAQACWQMKLPSSSSLLLSRLLTLPTGCGLLGQEATPVAMPLVRTLTHACTSEC